MKATGDIVEAAGLERDKYCDMLHENPADVIPLLLRNEDTIV